MVISTYEKKSLRELTAENIELKAQLALSRQWSKAWKNCCSAQRRAQAEMIVKSTDALEAIFDHVGAVRQEVHHSMGVSTVEKADRIFELHITDENCLLKILQGLKGIETHVQQGLTGYAEEYKINTDAESPHPASPLRPALRLLRGKN